MPYAECIIAANLGSATTLTYNIPKNLVGEVSPGSIVLVPIRNKRLPAVVSAISEKSEVKKIKDLIDVVDSLPPSMLEILSFVSKYYLTPLPIVVRSVLPQIPLRKRAGEKKSQEKYGEGFSTKVIFNISDLPKTTGQTLIICPTLSTVKKILAELPKNSAKSLTNINAKSDFFKIWQEFKNGELKYLVSTRQGVFIPGKNLESIVVIEEESSFYKDQMRPRYNAVDVAIKLAETKKIKLFLCTLAPSLEIVNKFKPLLPEPKPEMLKRFVTAELLPNQILTKLLVEEIRKSLAGKEKILLYYNRLGKARVASCYDCKQVFYCPNCSTPLILHQKNDELILICHQCNYRASFQKTCTNCGSTNLRMFGFGIQKIQEEVQKLFPNVKISMFQKGISFDEKAEIIISTSAVFQINESKKFGLIGLMWADSDLYIPDFRAGEKIFRLFQYAVSRLNLDGVIVAQTTTDQSELFTTAVTGNYKKFYAAELGKRKKLNLPPSSIQIAIKYSDKNPDMVLKNLNALKTILTKYGLQVSGPTPGYITRVRGKTIGYIMITAGGELKQAPAKIITNLPAPFSVDRDPMNLI